MIEAAIALPDAELAAILATLAAGEGCCGGRREALALLREDSPIYRGRGTSETERLRAFVMVALARAGLGDDLLPYVLEELETGTDPYAVAAAARTARLMSSVPEEAIELLPAAIDRIRHVDEFVHLEQFPAPPGAGTRTAIAEAIETLAAAGSPGRAAIEVLWRRAAAGSGFSPSAMTALAVARERSTPAGHCCADLATVPPSESQPIGASTATLGEVELENQDGVRARFADIFGGRTCLIAFFYTRCMNPDKCSRTISQLARVCDLIEPRLPGDAAIVAGISYDPAYDLADRLRRYGHDRGLRFGPRCQLLRTTGPFAPLRAGLQLGVGYGSATVNRHRIELVLLDAAGGIADIKTRRLWDASEAADALVALDAAGRAREGSAACCAS